MSVKCNIRYFANFLIWVFSLMKQWYRGYFAAFVCVMFLWSGLESTVYAKGEVLPPGFSRSGSGSGVVKKTIIPRSGFGPGSARSGSGAAKATTSMPVKKSSAKQNNSVEQSDLRLKYSSTPLEIVLQDYSEKTGKTLLLAPGLPTPTFTLRSQGTLTLDEYLSAIETVLSMHGVGLVPKGEKFIRVVPIADVVAEPGEIRESTLEGLVSEDSGAMVNQMIQLKYIDIAEATKSIKPLLHKYGKITPFERNNSIMVSDVPDNINRALQVIRFVDQPIDARETPQVIDIHFAKASDIKQKLMEIVTESQKEQNKSTVPKARNSGRPGVIRRGPAGVIRATRPTINTHSSATAQTLIEEAEHGIIRGKVEIVADERTNKLIIITRPENMPFFEKIIDVLDVETSPDVEVKVVRLEFANAKEVAGMLNDLIGANDKDAVPTAKPSGANGADRSQALDTYVNRLKKTGATASKKSKVGELSKDNIKILSDKRTNALILMASKGDLAALLGIIKDMDMMLSQVLIEAVIIDVKLGGSLDTGFSWIQNSLTTYNKNANGNKSPVSSFSGRLGGDLTTKRGDALGTTGLPHSGLGYFLTLYDLNLNAVIKAVSRDSRTKVISTPVLLTTDNTEAKLTSTEKIYVYKGTQTYYSGGTTSSGDAQYTQQDIGLELDVTPHINENKVVMMEIKQKISEPGDQSDGSIANLQGKTISRDRDIEASIAVKSGQTIVLGGQVREGNSRSRTKVPILGDIPLLGRLFNSTSSSKSRTETIVFITPYVMDSPDAVRNETVRRKESLNIKGMWKKGWSGSDLAEPQKDHWWDRSPKPSTSRRDFEWETSGGKTSRGYENSDDEVEQEPEVRPYNEIKSDVDEFLREQHEKADKLIKEKE